MKDLEHARIVLQNMLITADLGEQSRVAFPARSGPLQGSCAFRQARYIGASCHAQAADVAKLVDAPDLGSGGATRGGSSPSIRTKAL